MAELQSSKLTVRVRFPSAALVLHVQVRAGFPALLPRSSGSLFGGWAIRGPLPDPGHYATGTVVRVVALPWPPWPGYLLRRALLRRDLLALAPGNALVHAVGDLTVPLTGRVLVDKRGAHTRVAHPVHQLPGTGACRRRQVVPGVAEIVEMEPDRQTRLPDRLGPLHRAPKVAGPQEPALVADEDQSVLVGVDELEQM